MKKAFKKIAATCVAGSMLVAVPLTLAGCNNNDERDERISYLENKVDTLEENLGRANTLAEERYTKIGTLEQQLRDEKAEVTRLEQVIRALQDEEGLAADLLAAQNALAVASGNITRLEGELAAEKAALVTALANIVSYQTVLASVRSALGVETNPAVLTEIAKLQADIERLKRELAEALGEGDTGVSELPAETAVLEQAQAALDFIAGLNRYSTLQNIVDAYVKIDALMADIQRFALLPGTVIEQLTQADARLGNVPTTSVNNRLVVATGARGTGGIAGDIQVRLDAEARVSADATLNAVIATIRALPMIPTVDQVVAARTDFSDVNSAVRNAASAAVRVEFGIAGEILEAAEAILVERQLTEIKRANTGALAVAQAIVNGTLHPQSHNIWFSTWIDLVTDPTNPITHTPTITSELERFNAAITAVEVVIENVKTILNEVQLTNSQEEDLEDALESLVTYDRVKQDGKYVYIVDGGILYELIKLRDEVQLNQDVIDAITAVQDAVANLTGANITIPNVSAARALVTTANELVAKMPVGRAFLPTNTAIAQLGASAAQINAHVTGLLSTVDANIVEAVEAADLAIEASIVTFNNNDIVIPPTASREILRAEVEMLTEALEAAKSTRTDNIIASDLSDIDERIETLEDMIGALEERYGDIKTGEEAIEQIRQALGMLELLNHRSSTVTVASVYAFVEAIDTDAADIVNGAWSDALESLMDEVFGVDRDNAFFIRHATEATRFVDNAIEAFLAIEDYLDDEEKVTDEVLLLAFKNAEFVLNTFGAMADSAKTDELQSHVATLELELFERDLIEEDDMIHQA